MRHSGCIGPELENHERKIEYENTFSIIGAELENGKSQEFEKEFAAKEINPFGNFCWFLLVDRNMKRRE